MASEGYTTLRLQDKREHQRDRIAVLPGRSAERVRVILVHDAQIFKHDLCVVSLQVIIEPGRP